MLTLAAACMPSTRYVQITVTPPPRPVLPTVTADELECLDADAYRRLVERDRLRREYAEILESMLSSK